MRLATTLAVAITYKYESKSRIQQIRSFASILPGSYSPTANREVKLCPASQRQCEPCIFFGSDRKVGSEGWGHKGEKGAGASSDRSEAQRLVTYVSGEPSGRRRRRRNGGIWLGRARSRNRSLQTDYSKRKVEAAPLSLHLSLRIPGM